MLRKDISLLLLHSHLPNFPEKREGRGGEGRGGREGGREGGGEGKGRGREVGNLTEAG